MREDLMDLGRLSPDDAIIITALRAAMETWNWGRIEEIGLYLQEMARTKNRLDNFRRERL